MGFSLRCLADTSEKMGCKIHIFFQYFYIQTELKVNKIQKKILTNICNVQNDCIVAMTIVKTKELYNNCFK